MLLRHSSPVPPLTGFWRNPSGTESWNRRPLTMTRLPTLMLPAMMSWAAMIITTERAELNIEFWPKLRAAKD